MNNSIDKLTQFFTKFPGIGARQARRFVYFLLSQDKATLETFTKHIQSLAQDVVACSACGRYFVGVETQDTNCGICVDTGRDQAQLMIVEKDADLENIERSDAYTGRYFVLGGTVPVLDKSPQEKIRAHELVAYVKDKQPDEIILALSANPEGEHTAEYVTKLLLPLQKESTFSLSVLGRGLSTGTELEYSDAETIKSALGNRK